MYNLTFRSGVKVDAMIESFYPTSMNFNLKFHPFSPKIMKAKKSNLAQTTSGLSYRSPSPASDLKIA